MVEAVKDPEPDQKAGRQIELQDGEGARNTLEAVKGESKRHARDRYRQHG